LSAILSFPSTTGSSLQQQYQDLANQVTLATAKLDQLEQDFDARVEAGIPLDIFQAMEAEIRWQQKIVETLEKRRNEVDQLYADEQRKLAIDNQRKELLQHKENILSQLKETDAAIPQIRQQLIDLGVELGLKEQMRMRLLQEHAATEDKINAIR
jgi:seryl-tRNA synthetase